MWLRRGGRTRQRRRQKRPCSTRTELVAATVWRQGPTLANVDDNEPACRRCEDGCSISLKAYAGARRHLTDDLDL